MIRINLLPQAKKATRSAGPSGSSQTWAGIYLAALVAWVLVLGVVYFVYDGDLQEQQQANRVLQGQIDQLRTKSARLDEVRAQLEQSYALERVVEELNAGRTGPTRVMIEVAKILSQGGGPTIDAAELEALRADNPLAGFTRGWDVRRLWLTAFEEEEREVRIEGIGRSNEDVAELLKRLTLSELFTDVLLQQTQSTDGRDGPAFIEFELYCKVSY
ncbi:MAG: PilN domain-containing protein [Myxococcota bacterium]